MQRSPAFPVTTAQMETHDEPREHAPSSTTNTDAQGESPSHLPPPGSDEDVPPPKPPRPANPLQQAENTLKEAFPSIDPSVVKAVLRASGGNVEPAFNALLGRPR